VRHILADSAAKVVITAPELAAKVEGWAGPIILVGGHGDEWLAHESVATVERADGDLAVILYTSGTTGRPKGVALSHANLASNARAAASRYELDRERWNLGVLPLSHSYGLVTLNAGNILGTKSVLLRWFNPEAVLDAIARFRVQAMSGVPMMYVYLLNYPDADRFDTSSMRAWGSGAAALPLEIVEPFEKKFGGRLLEGYSLTEASPVVSTTRLSGVRKLGSVGQPLPGVEIAILDDDRALPVGDTGEIGVRGPNVMLGYYGLPEETVRALRNGWLHTGDVGRLDCRPCRKTRSGRFSGKSCEHWWDDGPAAHAAGPSRRDYLSLSSSILSARSSTASPTFRIALPNSSRSLPAARSARPSASSSGSFNASPASSLM